jgi:signal transduction histidine kinase
MPLLKSTALADVILYDESRQAIATTLGQQGMDDLFKQTVSIEDELYRSVVNGNGIVPGRDLGFDDRSYRVAYGQLKMADDRLAVFAVVLSSEYVAESGSLSRRDYALLYGAAMVAVILIGYFVARLIINPLLKLVRTSRAIAGGDLTRRTEITSRDEIGVLANTFDEMTEHLQQRTLELEKTNKILEQMDRTKVRFIQVAAHELRTPLTLVQGYAQMVEIKSKDSKDLIRYTTGILEGTARMVDIIDNMLDVSRIDTNQLQLKPAEVHIDEVIERVKKTFQAAFEERKLTFSTEGLVHLPVIQGDKDLLYKLFYHIIVNAIKYTPDGGHILVSGCLLEETGNELQIQIAVKDNGIGIDPQNQKLVFEKFYQTGEVLLHSSGKTKFMGGGPGLGLAIARGIVTAHRGSIWLESPGFDEMTNPGTTVFVQLPVNGHRESI